MGGWLYENTRIVWLRPALFRILAGAGLVKPLSPAFGSVWIGAVNASLYRMGSFMILLMMQRAPVHSAHGGIDLVPGGPVKSTKLTPANGLK